MADKSHDGTGAATTSSDLTVRDESTKAEYATASPFLRDRINGRLEGEQSPAFDVRSLDLSKLKDGDPKGPTLLVSAIGEFVADLSQKYDVNQDGVFAGKELHDLAEAVVDGAIKMTPSLEGQRAGLMAALDKLGSLSAEDLTALVTQTAQRADGNHDGTVDPQEYQALIRAASDKSLITR